MLKHTGTLEIESDRLKLRRFALEDVEAVFHNWANDDEVTRFLSWPTHPNSAVTKKVVQDWIESYENDEFYHWAIELKENGEAVGGITVVNSSNMHERCEMGYCIGREYWGKGITAEALETVNSFLFHEVGYNRIEAMHHSSNPASGRVMEKAGMKYEGVRYSYMRNKHGEFVDCDTYVIIKNV